MTTQDTGADRQIQIGSMIFLPSRKLLKGREGQVTLEDKMAELLDYLYRRQSDVVSRDDILAAIWAGRSLSEQTVPVAISKLRKAMREASGSDAALQTVPKRGYRLVPRDDDLDAETRKTFARPETRLRFWGAISLAVLVFIAVLAWPRQTPFVPAAGAEKPGLILTMKDIRTESEAPEDGESVIALSELASYYLSQTPEVLLIRHWWNFDAPDPTGGIFTRYGEDTPVYLLKGTLINDDGRKLVTLSLSIPRTNEVIWSGLHDVTSGSGEYFQLLADMYGHIGVFPKGASNDAGLEDHRYWVGRYMMHLANAGAARNAAKNLRAVMKDYPENETVHAALAALSARWPLEDYVADVREIPSEALVLDGGYQALVDRAAIAYFGQSDAAHALDFLDKALQIAPGDHYAWSLKAEVLAAKGQNGAALASFRKAARLAPFSRAYAARIEMLEVAREQ